MTPPGTARPAAGGVARAAWSRRLTAPNTPNTPDTVRHARMCTAETAGTGTVIRCPVLR